MSKSTVIQAYTDAIRTHTQKNIVGAGPPHNRRCRWLSLPAYADLSLKLKERNIKKTSS